MMIAILEHYERLVVVFRPVHIDPALVPLFEMYASNVHYYLRRGSGSSALGTAEEGSSAILAGGVSDEASLVAALLYGMVVDYYLSKGSASSAASACGDAAHRILPRNGSAFSVTCAQKLYQMVIDYYHAKGSGSSARSTANEAAQIIRRYT